MAKPLEDGGVYFRPSLDQVAPDFLPATITA